MLSNRALSRLFVAALIPGIAVTTFADDWPQWGGRNNRNMVSTEKGLPESFEADKDKAAEGRARNVKWLARLGAYAYGNPTVAGGRVFVGTNALTGV